MPEAAYPLTLEESERDYLRRVVDDKGLAIISRELGISGSVVTRALAGIPARAGSINLLRQAITAHRKSTAIAKSKGSAK